MRTLEKDRTMNAKGLIKSVARVYAITSPIAVSSMIVGFGVGFVAGTLANPTHGFTRANPFAKGAGAAK